MPWGLDSILSRCLDPDPNRRHARAGDLAEDLRRLLDDRPLKHAPERSLREVVAKWSRRNPRATGATTVFSVSVVLLGVIVGIAFLLADRLQVAEARQQLVAFDQALSECQLMLNTSSGPIEHLDRGLSLADAALAAYGLRRPDGWEPGPDVTRLPEDDRLQLLEQLSELIELRAARGSCRRNDDTTSRPCGTL